MAYFHRCTVLVQRSVATKLVKFHTTKNNHAILGYMFTVDWGIEGSASQQPSRLARLN
jgi:hypothetical protein